MTFEKSIAYTNIRCNNVFSRIRNNLGKADKYEARDTLTCRKYKKVGSIRVNVTFRLQIASISSNVVVLENINQNIDSLANVHPAQWLLKVLGPAYQKRLMDVPVVSPKCRSPKRALDSTLFSRS